MELFFKFIKEHSHLLLVGAIILFGSLVHATATLKIKRDSGANMTKLDFVILLPIAMFSGLLFALATALFADNQIIVILSAGAGSFLGLAGLNQISLSILEYLSTKIKK